MDSEDTSIVLKEIRDELKRVNARLDWFESTAKQSIQENQESDDGSTYYRSPPLRTYIIFAIILALFAAILLLGPNSSG